MGKVGSNQRRIPFHQVNSLGSDDNIQFSGLDHDDLLTGVNHRAFAILSMCFQLKTDNQRLGTNSADGSASADGNGIEWGCDKDVT